MYLDDFIAVLSFLALIAWIIFGFVKAIMKIGFLKNPIDKVKKDNFIITVKIIFGVILGGILFYFTPFIHEQAKFVLAIILCLSSFLILFILKNNPKYLVLSRVCILSGQVLFGISLLLLLINGAIGYSYSWIFALWTIFGIYIWHEFGNIENKLCTIFTCLGILLSAAVELSIDLYSNKLLIVLILGLCIIEIFSKKMNKLLETILKNIFVSILFVLSFSLWDYFVNNTTAFIIIGIYLIIALIINRKELSIKGILILCIPIPVLLLDKIDIREYTNVIGISFPVAAIMWIVGQRYLKVLSIIMVLAASFYIAESHEIIVLMTLITTIFIVLTSLFTKKANIPESAQEEVIENE